MIDDREIIYMITRTFKVEVEVKDAKADAKIMTFPIVFDTPESNGPTSTLASIAANRVDAQFYASPKFKTFGKNWTIRRVYDADIAGPAEPGHEVKNGK